MREYYKFPKEAKIILWRNFEEKVNFYSGELTTEKITKFIKIKTHPKLMNFDATAIDLIFTYKIPTVIMFTDDDHESEYQIF